MQWESPTTHSAGCGLLAAEEVSRHPAVLLVPHAQRPHGGSELHLEQQIHLLLTDQRHSAQTQAAGEELKLRFKLTFHMLFLCLSTVVEKLGAV